MPGDLAGRVLATLACWSDEERQAARDALQSRADPTAIRREAAAALEANKTRGTGVAPPVITVTTREEARTLFGRGSWLAEHAPLPFRSAAHLRHTFACQGCCGLFCMACEERVSPRDEIKTDVRWCANCPVRWPA